MTRIASYVELGANLGLGVEAVWTSIAQQAVDYRVLPDGRCDIILKFSANVGPITDLTVVVTGPTTTYYDVAVASGMGFVGIRLLPGFFRSVLGFKPGDLRGKALVGKAAVLACPPLAQLCADADTPDALPERLLAFVRSRCGRRLVLPSVQTRRILGALHASSGRLSVSEIAQMHGLSTRSVQRIVLDATGLPPKSYGRILQFHRALRLLRDHRLSPSDAAYEAGYADQSHMTHTLQRFGGLSPARLPDVTLVTLRT